jgi:PTH2 family peptidyl-tRNA hydrolase
MGKGKLSAQVAHAAVSSSEKVRKLRRDWYNEWIFSGQAKVVVKVDSLNDIFKVRDNADKENLLTSLIEDKGLTQIPQGSITCLGIGPGPITKIDRVTGKLKLL